MYAQEKRSWSQEAKGEEEKNLLIVKVFLLIQKFCEIWKFNSKVLYLKKKEIITILLCASKSEQEREEKWRAINYFGLHFASLSFASLRAEMDYKECQHGCE